MLPVPGVWREFRKGISTWVIRTGSPGQLEDLSRVGMLTASIGFPSELSEECAGIIQGPHKPALLAPQGANRSANIKCYVKARPNAFSTITISLTQTHTQTYTHEFQSLFFLDLSFAPILSYAHYLGHSCFSHTFTRCAHFDVFKIGSE